MSDFLSFHLTDSFIEPYQNKEVDWGFPIGGGNSLSELTFVLKYSRKKEDGTKERWWEVCRRCVEGMYSILKDHAKHYGTTWNEFKAQKSAQDAFDRMFHFKWTPPGRGMQHMGTRSIIEQRNMARLVNCSAIGSDKISTHSAYRATMPFVRFMEMSMNGVGVGVSTAGAGKITLHQPNEEVEVFAIPDTREGWAASLGILLESFFFKDRNTVEFDYSQIRPEGAALHSFGGVASGHRPLQKMHERVTERLSGRDGELLTSRDIADIINLAGKACTAGGTRRSATILFGEKDDEDYINLKNWNLPENDYRTGADGFAWASNNSVTVNSSDDLDDLIDLVAVNGEPGFLWVDMIQKYGRLADAPDYKDYRATLSNPCGEIPLEGQGELCNLSEIYPTNHETYEDFISTLKHAYMYTKVVTLLTTPWPETNEVNLRNRRVGISMTGLALFVETRGWSTLTEWQDGGYKELKRLDQKYSEWLGVRESIRLTTIKPAGCRPAESLTTTSAGILTLAEIMEEHPEDSEWATVNDLEVLRADGSTSISKSYDNGKSEVLKLSLTYGVELLATPEHKWFIARHYNGSTAPRYKEIQRWVETKDIQVDDVLEIQPSTYIKDTHSSLRKINMRAITMQSNAQGITQPLEMNEDLAWLLGYLWGDGAQSPSGYRIRFSDENMYNLERVNSIIEDHFGISGTIRGVGRGRSDFELSISSKQLWHWFIGQGFWKYYDDGTLDIIPRIIRSSSRSDIISFVAGLIDSDGCANITNGDQRYVQISNSVPRFTVHLQHVMWSVGLVVGRSFMNGSEKNGHWGHGCYSMSICGGLSDGESLKELCERSGKVRMMVEKNPTSRWASKVTQVAGRVKSVDSVGEMETFDIEVPDGNWYLNGAFKSHNSTSLVTSVTPGVHWPTTSNYHLRRIRFLHTDPLVNILEKAGYHVEPDQGDPDSTVVVTFPTKGVNIRSEREVSVWEKAALAVSCQRYWSDNMVSCTLSFLPHEVKELSPLLSSYRGQMKSASFLPIDESGTTYAQAPYEPVSEADALEWMSRIQPLDEESLYGNTMNDFIEDKFCTTESCEIPQR